MTNKPTVSLQAYIRSGSVQKVIEESIGKNSADFTTSLLSTVNSSPVLQDCPPESVIKAAITAAAMHLPIDPNLGFAYIIPYNNKKKIKEVNPETGVVTWREEWATEAQFQLGYKGFIQLAQRSGEFERINATDIREGELKKIDRLSGELDIEWVEDNTARNKLPVIGYIGYFKLLNGFKKELYMTKAELENHAKKYSKSFAKGYGLWRDEFDTMAKKTVLKLLISKYGQLSTSLQKAVQADQAVVEEDSFNYIDNDKSEVKETEEKAPKQVEAGSKGKPKPAKGTKPSPRKEVAKK